MYKLVVVVQAKLVFMSRLAILILLFNPEHPAISLHRFLRHLFVSQGVELLCQVFIQLVLYFGPFFDKVYLTLQVVYQCLLGVLLLPKGF